MTTLTQMISLPQSALEISDPAGIGLMWAEVIVGMIGSATCLLVIVSTIRKNCNAHTLLILMLSWADLFFNVHAVAVVSSVLYMRGFFLGIPACISSAVASVATSYLSITSLFFITFDRYQSIQGRMALTRRDALYIMIAQVVSGIILVTWPLTFGYLDIYAMQSSKTLCCLAFFNHDTIPVMNTILSFSIIMGCAIYINFAYGSILWKYYKMKPKSASNNLQTFQESKMSEIQRQDMQQKETKKLESRLLTKCVSMTGLYLVCWSPYAVKVCYELFTGKQVPPTLDGICSLMPIFNATLNPLILYIYDPSIRQNIRELFIKD